MDSMDVMRPVERGLRIYVEAYKRIWGKWNHRKALVFCLTNFDTTHTQDMERIKLIQDCECQPYVMIYNKPSAPSITRRLQQWTNNYQAYNAFHDFYEFQKFKFKTVVYPWSKDKKETTSDWLDRILKIT